MRPLICVGLGSALVVLTVLAAKPLLLSSSGAETALAIQNPIPGGYIDPDQLREYHDLTTKQQAALLRNSMKMEVATELIRGNLTLSEASARFREITLTDAAGLTYLRRAYPAAADEELHYRNVIGVVRGLLAREPERRADLVERLEAEVRARFPTNAANGIPAV
jgi:hypothetical protein